MTENHTPAVSSLPPLGMPDLSRIVSDLFAMSANTERLQKVYREVTSAHRIHPKIVPDLFAMSTNPESLQRMLRALTGVPQAKISTASYIGIVPALKRWAPVYEGGSFLVSNAFAFQRTSAAAAATVATVAWQRLSVPPQEVKPGSFDAQFAAVSCLVTEDVLPEGLSPQVSEADEPEILQAAATNLGLSTVPESPERKRVLELIVGYTVMILYVCTQAGVTGEDWTPSLWLDATTAGGLAVASVKWGPELLKSLMGP